MRHSGLSHYSPPLWYVYYDWGALGYLTTSVGGGYKGKDPDFQRYIIMACLNSLSKNLFIEK